MKTYVPNKKDFQNRKWYLADANGQILGDLAVKIVNVLRGKNKAVYSPHVDCGDYVVVINATKVKVTGNKEQGKIYYSHSGYMGHLSSQTYAEVMTKTPLRIIREAVSGMLPKNSLRKQIMRRLKIFTGNEHTLKSQQFLPL